VYVVWAWSVSEWCEKDGPDSPDLHLSECWRMFLPLLHLRAAAVETMDTLVFRHLPHRPAFFHSYLKAGFGLLSPHRVHTPPGKSCMYGQVWALTY